MEKIADFFKLFKQGEAVSNGAAWTTGQITVTAIAGVLLAAVKFIGDFGITLPVDPAQAASIGGGILALFNVGLSIATSRNHGMPASGKPDAGPGN